MDKFLKIIIEEEEDSGINLFRDRMNEQRFKYYALEIAKKLGIDASTVLPKALNDAMKVCSLNGVTLEEHFKPIFKDTTDGLYEDYKLTPLALALVSINCEVAGNTKLAKLQFRLVEKALSISED